MAELTVYYNGNPVLKEPLNKAITIGRGGSSDIILTHLAEDAQLTIKMAKNRYFLISQKEAAYVNGERAIGSTMLNDNDLIDVGPYRLHFVEHGTSSFNVEQHEKTVTISFHQKSHPAHDVMPVIQFTEPFKTKKRQIRIIIGRGAGCDIRLDDRCVSSRHAEVSLQNNQYYVQDMNSKNGTFINDRRVERELLPARGIIRLGQVSLSYRIEYPISGFGEGIEAYPIPSAGSQDRFLVGKSESFKNIINELAKVAIQDDDVLLLGETGVGKDLLAHYTHYNNPRRHKNPFIAVNCASIPSTLAGSQLFGHTKGAFTGAVADHKGLFKQADGGTLFLDEIGELPVEVQASLLRVMEDGVVRPVGSEKDIQVDVRIIAATNKDVKEAQREGKFRHDLYERFDWMVSIPPLRERTDDIPVLAKYFVCLHSPTPVNISDEVLSYLKRLQWSGNVRSLNRAVRKAIANALARGSRELSISDFEGLDMPLQEIKEDKRELLVETAQLYKGNVSNIAKALKITRPTVRHWCQRYKIDLKEYRNRGRT